MKNKLRGWASQSGDYVTSYYSREHLAVLEEAGIEEIVLDPDSVLENDMDLTRIGSGGRSNVYAVDDTGIVVKKHFPTYYYTGEWINRRNTTATILANLRVNVAFEKALREDPDYTTPLYLGHLVLRDYNRETWNYTLMTGLNTVDRNDLSAAERQRFRCLCKVAMWHCLEALGKQDLPTTYIRWKEAVPYYNLLPVRDEEGVKTGIIDLESTQARYPIANYDPPRRRWADPWIGNI
jgi:hypothetical protein